VAERALEVRRKRCLDQDRVVQLLDVGRDAKHGHGLEPAERVASLKQLSRVPLVQCSGDEQRDVVDHVAVREVFHELGERAGGVGLDVAKLGDELVRCLSGECRRRGIGRQRVEEVAVRWRQLQLDI
jgi:hypothetical protein